MHEHDPDATDPKSSVQLAGKALAEDDVPFTEPDIHLEASQRVKGPLPAQSGHPQAWQKGGSIGQ